MKRTSLDLIEVEPEKFLKLEPITTQEGSENFIIPAKACYKTPLRVAIKKTLTDFAEHTTIHGISYIFDGVIPRFERFIWFLIFGFFGTLAMYWTGTDYYLWQGNPVLTSIKSTGLPIHNVEFPAITICSHGQIKNVLDNAINKQFKDFVIMKIKKKEENKRRRKRDLNLKQSFMTDLGLTNMEVEELKVKYMQEYYPGLKIDQLSNIVEILAAEDPERTIKSKVLTDPESIPFVDIHLSSTTATTTTVAILTTAITTTTTTTETTSSIITTTTTTTTTIPPNNCCKSIDILIGEHSKGPFEYKGTSNDHPYWIYKNEWSTKAMWFKSGYWHIGTENNLGSINSWWISSKLYENSECPTESNIEWETLNHTTSEWIELSEIYLYCLDHCYEIDTDYDVETGTGTDIEPTWEGILHDKDKALSCQHFCQKNEYCQFWTYTLSTYTGPGNPKTCYLKTQKGIVKNLEKAKSGPKYCPSSKRRRKREAVEFDSGDVTEQFLESLETTFTTFKTTPAPITTSTTTTNSSSTSTTSTSTTIATTTSTSTVTTSTTTTTTSTSTVTSTTTTAAITTATSSTTTYATTTTTTSTTTTKEIYYCKNCTLDKVFVPDKRLEHDEVAKQARLNFTDNFRQMDLLKIYPKMMEILWYTQLPCFDIEGISSKKNEFGMLKACLWQGKEFPCSELFSAFPTNQGMCCSFNMKKANEMFQASQYQEILDNMQSLDKNQSFVKDVDEQNEKVEESWNKKPISQTGRKKGLQVVLDAHSDYLSGGTVPEDFDGFSAIIDSNNQFPTVNRKTVLIRPGHSNMVSMKATIISSDPDISQFDPDLRHCLFPDDMKMNIHKRYSQANCLLECIMDFAMREMNLTTPCIPWYLPINDTSGSEICTPWEAKEFREAMDETPGDYCDHCLPDCDIILYEASISAAPFRHCDYKNLGVSYLCDFDGTVSPKIWGQKVQDQYMKEISSIPLYISNDAESNYRRYADKSKGKGTPIFTAANEKEPTYNAYDKDISMVTFFFETGTVVEYIREQKLQVIQFMAQVGGLMGLCTGFSLISGIEILYWLILRFFRNL